VGTVLYNNELAIMVLEYRCSLFTLYDLCVSSLRRGQPKIMVQVRKSSDLGCLVQSSCLDKIR